MRRIEPPSVRVLEDLDARCFASDVAPSLHDRRPEVLRIDLGASSLRRCILAIPLIDALVRRFAGSRVRIRARESAAALLRAHVAAAQASGPTRRCDGGDRLTIDLQPGIGRAPRWVDAARTRLRVPSAPFPWREQTHAQHWVDAAVCAGLWPAATIPELAVSKAACDEARRFARARFGLLGGPLVALFPSPRVRVSWGASRFADVLRALEREMGARGISIGGPGVEGALAVARSTPADVRAALLTLCSVTIGDDDGWSHVAAAVGAPVITVHGRTSPKSRGPLCSARAALSTTCRVPDAHAARRPRRRAERCLACLEPRDVVDAALRLSAERWPWDRLARLGR